MKLLITILLLTNIAWCINPLDSIAPNDKQLHFMANYIITDQVKRHTALSDLDIFMVILGASIVKEYVVDDKPDNNDILANLCGYGVRVVF